MDGEGFEPSKSSTTDLQSAPFGHSGTHPYDILTRNYYAITGDKMQAFFQIVSVLSYRKMTDDVLRHTAADTAKPEFIILIRSMKHTLSYHVQ